MCHKHMQRLVVKGTTLSPQLEAGKVLLSLIKTLPKTDKELFQKRFLKYVFRYINFLNERSVNPLTGKREYTHRDLKYAFSSLERFLPFLFVYKQNKDIPNTSNSLEGHFGHIKDVLRIHRGLSRSLKERVVETILIESSIAPKLD